MNRRGSVSRLGLAGAALGVAAGAVQAIAGADIPQWTGAKASPVPLGLLTIGLSVLAGAAALAQRRPLSAGTRAACAVGLIGPALIGLTTVGRLWYVPAALLLAAGLSTVDNWRATRAALARDWFRVLLSVLGLAELVMAARAAPAALATGIAGGVALLAAARLRTVPRRTLAALLVVGTIPFAVAGWAGIGPVVLALAVLTVAPAVLRDPQIRPSSRAAATASRREATPSLR